MSIRNLIFSSVGATLISTAALSETQSYQLAVCSLPDFIAGKVLMICENEGEVSLPGFELPNLICYNSLQEGMRECSYDDIPQDCGGEDIEGCTIPENDI